ncbi:MAG TPA: D-aminoacyl-tRNA deacylase [Phycisphaerae bacterium]
MVAVLQRVSRASVSVAGTIVSQIPTGLLVLAAVEARDTSADLTWIAQKLATLRIFKNGAGDKNFDQDIRQIGGHILLVSNFTVAAETAKGRRPSLSNAAPPDRANLMFEELVAAVRAQNLPVQTGQFGADMLVELANDGPVTFILQSPVDPATSASTP